MRAAVAGNQLDRVGQERAVVFPGEWVEQMNASDVAVASFGGKQTGRTADVEQLARHAPSLELREQQVEANAVTPHDNQIGDFKLATDQADLDRLTRFEDLGVTRDRDEAVCATERRHRSRSLSHRKRGQPIVRLHETDEQILGATDLGIRFHGERCPDGLVRFGLSSAE